MRNTVTAVAVVLLAAVLFNRSAAEAQQAPVGQRWEYAKLSFDPQSRTSRSVLWTGGKVYIGEDLGTALGVKDWQTDHIDQPLMHLGLAGWEAVSMIGNADDSVGAREILLKRPVR
ncbi:MAG TPA: hypothetical protein VF595_06160 [Tepidisphaeraceae bacterium]|jgi:hypothetical protein